MLCLQQVWDEAQANGCLQRKHIGQQPRDWADDRFTATETGNGEWITTSRHYVTTSRRQIATSLHNVPSLCHGITLQRHYIKPLLDVITSHPNAIKRRHVTSSSHSTLGRYFPSQYDAVVHITRSLTLLWRCVLIKYTMNVQISINKCRSGWIIRQVCL